MKEVRNIVEQLKEQAAAEVRTLLEKDQTYAEISLQIFDIYRNGSDLKELMNSHLLNDKSFKIFERIIYLTVLRYYGLEDNSMKDVLATNVFYALNGNSHKEKSERITELEGYFHAMKRYEIEEEASSLLSELYLLSQGSQLETVYRHLYLKYKELDSLISDALLTFERLNGELNTYMITGNQNAVRDMISEYKQLRKFSEAQPESRSLRCLLNLAKLNLVVVAGQDQLLRDGDQCIQDLLFSCKNQIDSLAFGMKRFYLQNIHSQLAALYAIQESDISSAIEIMNKVNSKGMEQASNLGFPAVLFRDIRNKIIEHKFHTRKHSVKKENIIKTKFNAVQQALSYAASSDLFGRNQYSYIVN